MDIAITAVGLNKGAARVWLQGNTLLRNGFTPGTKYRRVAKDGALTLIMAEDGSVSVPALPGTVREVSSRKKNDKQIPIIDINNNEVAQLFEGMTHVRVIFQKGKIVIIPLASELRARARLDRATFKLASGQPLSMGSFAHGGGILSHALEQGLAAEGVHSQLVVANEYREDLVDHVMAHNSTWSPATISLRGPMQEFAYDPQVLGLIASQLGDNGELDVLEAGIPCSGASVAGRAKRGLVHAEAHPEVGHLIAPFIALVARFNPSTVILENVPQYLTTASMDILRGMLRDLKYDVHESLVNGGDWNALEHRERMVMVAVTRGMHLDFESLLRPAHRARRLGEILDNPPLTAACWSEMKGLKAKAIRDKAAGKCFAMQVFQADSPKINTLTKGIGKNRSTDPKIQHPSNPNLLRIPSPAEHARAKGIPEVLISGLSATTAHELLGQSICYAPFVSIGRLLGTTYKKLSTAK